MFVAPDIIQVQIPLPFPLKFVNCYLVYGPQGWALIDTGVNWPPALEAWHAALERFDIPFDAIRQIYVTHHHIDHVGLAGWWQQRTGASVLMTPGEAAMAQRIWGDPQSSYATVAFFGAHGMPQTFAQTLVEQTTYAYALTEPLAELMVLDGLHSETAALPTVEIVGRTFQPLVVSGHSDEQLLLYEPRTRTLLAADHVLPRISPNISIFPGTRPNPLGRFLATFPALSALDVTTVLPGHGAIFHDLPGRLAELESHHLHRLNQIVDALGDVATGYEVAMRVFPLDALQSHQVQFAMGETLAHLDYLVAQGRVELVNEDRLLYRPC